MYICFHTMHFGRIQYTKVYSVLYSQISLFIQKLLLHNVHMGNGNFDILKLFF